MKGNGLIFLFLQPQASSAGCGSLLPVPSQSWVTRGGKPNLQGKDVLGYPGWLSCAEIEMGPCMYVREHMYVTRQGQSASCHLEPSSPRGSLPSFHCAHYAQGTQSAHPSSEMQVGGA